MYFDTEVLKMTFATIHLAEHVTQYEEILQLL